MAQTGKIGRQGEIEPAGKRARRAVRDELPAPQPVYQDRTPSLPRELKTAPFYILSGVMLFLIWQIAVILTTESARRFLVPTPAAVATRFIKLARDGTLTHHVSITLLEMGLGLALGTTVAVLLGYAVAHSTLLKYLLQPVIVVSQAVPIVALAPLLTVWFGSGLTSKVVVCALIVFFPILVNVMTGIESIDPRLRDLFRMLEATRFQVLLQLEVPGALPAFLSGLKVGGTLAGMGAVVGEFVSSTAGLGYLVKQGQNLYDLPMMFVAVIVLMAIATTIYTLLTLLARALLRWQQRA
ncbi:MAG: ABC transporter permease [Anaerolineae bacterium]